jgi:phosphoribosylaminoimidazolecarboxamide formyltransferase/IMP cyclohydrolase
MPRALLSVSDKTGIVDLARGLAARGFELISTGGTARTLTDAGLTVTNVSDLTGFPEMMDGRVKTLHPAIHAGILARRDHPDDLRAIAQHGIHPIDVVVVNLYPFADTAKKPGVTFDDLVEQIDIGGPSLVRAAAKNFRDVLIVVNPENYPRVLEAIDGGATREFRYELMVQAFAHTAEYDSTIAATLLQVNERGRVVPAADTGVRRGLDGCPPEDRRSALRREPAPESRVVPPLTRSADVQRCRVG